MVISAMPPPGHRVTIRGSQTGGGYRHLAVHAADCADTWLASITYIAEGKEVDGKPSLRYLSLLRDGARAHGLPANYLRFLESVEHAG